MDIIKCAIYIRVSTDEQVKEGHSLEAQEERLRFFAKSQGWNIFKVYKDEGFSAKDLNRPALKDLFYDAKLNRFDVILIYKIDRLSRKLKDLIEIVLQLDKYKIGVKSATETIDTTTPSGRLIFHQFGSFAQYERELIGERTKFGMIKRLKQGYWNTLPPYGYKLIDGKLEVDKKESEMVKKIFEFYVQKNMGIVNISRKLTETGYKPRKSKTGRWRSNTIHNILTNPIYIGKVRWGGEEADGIHQAIMDKALFEFVQDKLNKRRRWTQRYDSPNNFLGIVKCGLCNSPMALHYPGNEKKRKYKYYICSQRKSFKSCHQDYIRADILEKSLINEIKKISQHRKEIYGFVNEYKRFNLRKLKELEAKKLDVDKGLKSIEDEKEKLYEWVIQNKPTDEGKNFLNQKTEEINYKEWELKKELWNIEDRINDIQTGKVNEEIITNYLENFVKIYDELEAGEKKVLIESLVKEVIIKGDKEIKMTLQIPFEKFRVSIPAISPKGTNNRNRFILHLSYNLMVYYNNLNGISTLSTPYSKSRFIL